MVVWCGCAGFVLWPLALGIWFSGRRVAMWVCYYLVLPGLICFNSVVFLFMFVVGWLVGRCLFV